ncbi:MAG: redoxin family protein [Pseudomonadota bacterium]
MMIGAVHSLAPRRRYVRSAAAGQRRRTGRRGAALLAVALWLGAGLSLPALAAESPPLDGFLRGNFKLSNPPAPVPKTRFKDPAGRNVSLAKFRGRVVLLNFWATWCAPCVEEMPQLNNLQARLRDEGLAVVTVSIDQGGAATVKPFLAQHRLRYLKAYLDPGSTLMHKLGGRGLPTTVLIDKQGRVVGKMQGGAAWNSPAAIALIRHYLGTGRSTPGDGGTLDWAEQGDEDAAYEAYQRGDYKTAYRNWRPLAEDGDAAAQFNIAVLYDYGEGMAEDNPTAAAWYRRSAAQGFAAAQYELAVMLANGEGVAQDLALAYALFDLAAAQDPDAGTQRDALVQHLSDADAERARQLVARARNEGAASLLGGGLTAGPSRALVRDVQEALNALGYDAGGADGLTGPKTRAAVRAFQADRALPVDGQISEQLLSELQAAEN